MGWVKYSTVGAKAGTDLKDAAGNVLADSAVKNSAVTISSAGALSGAGGGTVAIGSLSGSSSYQNSQISISSAGALSGAGGGTVAIASLSGSSGYNNQSITVNTTTGVLENIGTGSIKVNNAKQLYTDITDTKPPTNATAGATWGGNITSQPSDANILNSGTFTGTIGSNSNQAVSVVNALSRINKITNAGEFSGSLAAAQFPRVGVLTAASTTLARAAIGAGTSNVAVGTGGGDALAGNTSIPPDVTASSGGTVHTTNYKSTKAELGLSYTDGATVGAVFGTNMYDTNGSTNLTAALVKNSSITLNVLGYLDNIGTTERLSNTKLIATDMAGSGKPFAVLPASAATNNGSTINTSGNVAGVITVGSNISISSTSEYILISD